MKTPDFDEPIRSQFCDWVADLHGWFFPTSTANTPLAQWKELYQELISVGQPNTNSQLEGWTKINHLAAQEVIAALELMKLTQRSTTGPSKSRTRASLQAAKYIKVLEDHYPRRANNFQGQVVTAYSTDHQHIHIEVELRNQVFHLSVSYVWSLPGAEAINQLSLFPPTQITNVKTVNSDCFSAPNLQIQVVGFPGKPVIHDLNNQTFARLTQGKPQIIYGDEAGPLIPNSLEYLHAPRRCRLDLITTEGTYSLPFWAYPNYEHDCLETLFLKDPSHPLMQTSESDIEYISNSKAPSPANLKKQINKADSIPPPSALISQPLNLKPTPRDIRKKAIREDIERSTHTKTSRRSLAHAGDYQQNRLTVGFTLDAAHRAALVVRKAINQYLLGEYGIEVSLAKTGWQQFGAISLRTISLEQDERHYWSCQLDEGHGNQLRITTLDQPERSISMVSIEGWRSDHQRCESQLLKYLISALDLRDGGISLSTPQIVESNQVENLVSQIRHPQRELLLLVRVGESEKELENLQIPRSWWLPSLGLTHLRLIDIEAANILNLALGDEEPIQRGDIVMFLPGAGGDNPEDTELILAGEEVLSAPEKKVGELIANTAYETANRSSRSKWGQRKRNQLESNYLKQLENQVIHSSTLETNTIAHLKELYSYINSLQEELTMVYRERDSHNA